MHARRRHSGAAVPINPRLPTRNRTLVLDAQAVYLKVCSIFGPGGGLPGGKVKVRIEARHAAEVATRPALLSVGSRSLTAVSTSHKILNGQAKARDALLLSSLCSPARSAAATADVALPNSDRCCR